MRRLLLFFLLALNCSAQNANPNSSPAFDAKPWLEDFHQILSEMSSHYANLEWAVADRKMNLPQVRQETESKLRSADDDNAARRIVDKFLASFGDGHVEIEWPKPTASSKPPSAPPQSLCERMGYTARLKPGLNFLGFPEFSVESTPEAKFFPGGLLRLQNRVTLGVLRIALFTEHSYPELCQQAVKQLHLADNSDCDDKCDDKIEIATANLLTTALAKQAAALKTAGATTLLIDITHNGGGSDWVEAASRALSPVALRASKIAYLKHEHWTKDLQTRLRDVQTDIRNHAASPISLDDSAAKLQKAIEASRKSCDATGVWETGKLNCSLLVRDVLFSSGIIDYAKPGAFGPLESAAGLFLPSRYTYTEKTSALPLYVVIDRDTWSAAEYFAALLQDAHSATIIGEVSGGAGCGYTNGGIPTKLKNSSAILKMPDCVRYRADGSNETNGIVPDILLPWTGHDSEFQRAKKFLAALDLQLTANH